MQDTIFKIKADLGSEAIILNTRKFKRGLFGIFGKTNVEVIAGLEEENNKNSLQASDEINNLKDMIENLNKHWQSDSFSRELPSELGMIYQYLEKQGVDIELNRDFIRKLNLSHYENGQLIQVLEKEIEDFLGNPSPIICEDSPRIVSFIGPTGIGKTTTIAKLAAYYSLDQGKKVGLITADTYRIAAIEQLKTYSDIIDIPLHVVYNNEDLSKVINEKLSDFDMILIDTAGSSWNDKMQIGKLKKLVDRKLVDEMHLIISMNMKRSDIDAVIGRFSELKPDKIILSKLDETKTYGDILNIKRKYNYPYSYITFGQNVPDDIQVAETLSLVKYLLSDFYE